MNVVIVDSFRNKLQAYSRLINPRRLDISASYKIWKWLRILRPCRRKNIKGVKFSAVSGCRVIYNVVTVTNLYSNLQRRFLN